MDNTGRLGMHWLIQRPRLVVVLLIFGHFLFDLFVIPMLYTPIPTNVSLHLALVWPLAGVFFAQISMLSAYWIMGRGHELERTMVTCVGLCLLWYGVTQGLQATGDPSFSDSIELLTFLVCLTAFAELSLVMALFRANSSSRWTRIIAQQQSNLAVQRIHDEDDFVGVTKPNLTVELRTERGPVPDDLPSSSAVNPFSDDDRIRIDRRGSAHQFGLMHLFQETFSVAVILSVMLSPTGRAIWAHTIPDSYIFFLWFLLTLFMIPYSLVGAGITAAFLLGGFSRWQVELNVTRVFTGLVILGIGEILLSIMFAHSPIVGLMGCAQIVGMSVEFLICMLVLRPLGYRFDWDREVP